MLWVFRKGSFVVVGPGEREMGWSVLGSQSAEKLVDGLETETQNLQRLGQVFCLVGDGKERGLVCHCTFGL